MENTHSHRIKHDLLGIKATIRASRPLSERDIFDILKKQDPNLPSTLLTKYRNVRESQNSKIESGNEPDLELLGRYERSALKAMDNGFFETEGSFSDGLKEGAKMIAKGARRVPISMNLSKNLRAISNRSPSGDPTKYDGDRWAKGVEDSARQLYGYAKTDKALELGFPTPFDLFDPVAIAGQYFSDFDKNMDRALKFGGMPNNPSAKRKVMDRVLELDQGEAKATKGQAAMDVGGGLSMLGEKVAEVLKTNPINPLDIGIKTAIVKATGDNLKDFDRRAQLDYLANQDHIIRGMEEGAEIAAQVGTQLSKGIGDESLVQRELGALVESPFGGAETLTDIKTGAVQPDRDQAAFLSIPMSPDVPLTMGASGALSAIRNVTSRGAILSLSRKATLENSAKTALAQFKSIPKPNAVQKKLIARAEKVLSENAGAQQKLNLVVNKNKAIGQRVGIEEGVTKSGNYNLLGQRVQEALSRTTGPEASITRKVTGKALEKAGIGTERLGRALELMHRVPDEFIARALINIGFQAEKIPSVLKTLRLAGVGAVGYSAELDPNAAEALGLILLTPGGYSFLTRAGSDLSILGRQLQYAKASSPLFQRLAQMDSANPSLAEVTIDRTAALTIPEAVSDVTSQVLSPTRNFGISPMLKGPSTFLTKTGLGNTLESAASTAKTATYASAFPLAFGYAVGGEEGAGMGLGASLFPLTVGMGVGHFANLNSKFDLAQKLAGDEVIFKDSLDATSKTIFESMPKQVRQAIATGQMQNPDVLIDFRKGRGNSSYQVVDGESQITIYEKTSAAEVMQAVMGHEIAHHIDKFGYSTLIQEQLLGSVEKNKPGIFTEFDKDNKPIIITKPDGTKVYKTNKEFDGHRQVYLDKVEDSGYGPGTREYDYYKENNSEIAREIFASHGAAEFFGGKFVKANYEGAGSKLVRSLARPIFNSNGMRNFFHRIGLASNERGLVADPTKLMPGLKEIPELTNMIRKYNSEMRGLDTEGRRAWARRSGNLVDNEFADEFASAKLTAKDLENPAVVERLKAGGHVAVKILEDGTAEIQTDASGRPVFLPTREVNKQNKRLSKDILDILRKKQGQFKEGHVEIETTATGAERASGGFLGADVIAELKKLKKYNSHQLDALAAISKSIESGGGDAWDLFYYSALKFNKAGRKVYGQIKGGDRLSIPFGMEVTKDGNILINTISVDQFRNNLKYFSTSNKFKRKFAQAFNASNETDATLAAFRALPLYLENQRNNVPNDGTNGVTVAQRDFINAALGSVNNEQVIKNPILDAMGKNKRDRSVAIRSRRLDRIGQATQSPRSFGKYDPNKVSQNLMPQMEMDFSPPKAAQSLEAKPNFWKIYRINPKGPKVYDQVADVLIQVGSPWMDGSIAESQAGKLRLDQNKLLDAMDRAHRRADRGGGKMFMPASEAGASKGNVKTKSDPAPLGKLSATFPQWDAIAELQKEGRIVRDAIPGKNRTVIAKVERGAGMTYDVIIKPDGTFDAGEGNILFMPQMAMQKDPTVKYQYDPKTMDQPPVKTISTLSGERLAGVLEADRHDARGSRMAGPAHPFLKSNQVTATVDGIEWKPVWANMKYQFVKTQIGKQINSTNGYNLVAIMDEFAHRSNRDVFTRMMKKIQTASKKMTPEQKLITAQIINIFDNRYTPKKERKQPLQKSMDKFISDLGTAKSQATRGNLDGFNKLLNQAVSKVQDKSWWTNNNVKSNSKDFRRYTKEMTFNKRGAILKALEGLPWLPDIQKFLKSEMDFEGAPTDKAILAVQLSKHKLNTDDRIFAIYTGKDPDQAKWMTDNERKVLKQLRANPKFREHPSYDWMMLGRADADNFYFDRPIDLDKLIPKYRSDHKKFKTQEYKKQLDKNRKFLSSTPESKGLLFAGEGDKLDKAFIKTFLDTKAKKAGIENVYRGKSRLVVGAMKRNSQIPIIIP